MARGQPKVLADLGAFSNDYKRNFSLLYPYMARYWESYAVLLFNMFLGIFTTLFFAWFLKNITDAATHQDIHEIERLLIYGFAIIVGTESINYGVTYVRTSTVEKISRDLSVDLYRETLRMRGSSYASYHSGDLLARLTNDIEIVVDAMALHLIEIIGMPLVVISAFVYLFTVNKELSIICVCLGPLTLVFGFLMGKLLRTNGRLIQAYYGKVYAFLNESLSGHMVVQAFNLEGLFVDKYVNHRNQLVSYEMREVKIKGAFRIVSRVGGYFAYFLCIGLGGYFVARGNMSVGSLFAFTSLTQRLVGLFKGMSGQLSGLQRAFASAERLWKVFDEPKEDVRPSQFGLAQGVESGVSIKFDSVSFAYPLGSNVLEDFSMTVPSGKVIALVGPTGAGKSTLLKLIMGFYEPLQGRIFIDGQTTARMAPSILRSQIAYVPQDTFLFKGTIRENILYGRPDASELEIINAAKDANVHEFILSLPDKYETEIGENGLRLSGGQKQRIAIARAILKNAPVLLLDEATSALDSETEALVRDALHRQMKNRTTLVIAHRLSTIQHADVIVVLDEGRIVEQGRHEALLLNHGLYSRLYHMQFSANAVGFFQS